MLHEVVAALIVRSRMILLGQRSASREFYPGVWDVFGGHVEPGEEHSAIAWFSLEETGRLSLAFPDYPTLFARYIDADSNDPSLEKRP